MPIVKKSVVESVNFGDLSSEVYSHGGNFDLPEGDYIFTDLNVLLFDGFNIEKSTGKRLGVMIDIVPLEDPTASILLASGEAHPGKLFYSLGSKAMDSFVPNATGKGIQPIPGGKGKIPDSTNWVIFVKSLQDSGLPAGTFTNDVDVLAGTHVHMSNIPEPKERDSFQSKTGDNTGTQEKRYPRNIAVVTEIKDDGKPWEGTGGVPDVEEKPKKVVGKVLQKTGVKVPAKKVEPEPQVVEENEDVKTAALGGIATVVEANPKGLPKAALKVKVAKEVKALYDDGMMNAVVETYWSGSDEGLQALLAEVGYEMSGPMIKPIA